MTGSNRIEEVDISKGIGMVLVITGHLCVSASLRNFIYSFHMPLFFILSGIVYNIARTRARKAIQIKKILTKYIEWSGIYLVFDYIVRYSVEGTRTKHELWNEVVYTISFYGVFTEVERMSFVLFGILYASRCNNFHGNVAARMNSINANKDTFKMYTDMFLTEYIILAIHLNSQGALSDVVLNKVKKNANLMI